MNSRIKKYLNSIQNQDVFDFFKQLPDNTIDLVLTDPPYFLDKLDNAWNSAKINEEKTYCKLVTSLPPGMKFDKEQSRLFYDWYLKVSSEVFRVLKPGGFFFSFSSPRLFHKMTCAIDDAGFMIRDVFLWIYTQNQPKAMSLNHFIDKDKKLSKTEKQQLKSALNGWKTPQLKSCFEPIAVAQKPTEGTFLENIQKYKVGLMNTQLNVGLEKTMFPSNILTTDLHFNTFDKYFLVDKPDKSEKGIYNTHKTVKPLSLCEHLIKLTTFDEDAIVLDPFAGSGTTLVAAKKCNRFFIGNDINEEYIRIAERRLKEVDTNISANVRKNTINQSSLFDNQDKHKVKQS